MVQHRYHDMSADYFRISDRWMENGSASACDFYYFIFRLSSIAKRVDKLNLMKEAEAEKETEDEDW